MSEDKKKLAVLISQGANGDRSTIAFTIANAALSAGMDVLVFLLSDGVELCRDGAADKTVVSPFKPLGELIDAFVGNGGVLGACGSCFQFRGMSPEHNHAGVQVAGVAMLASWLADGATTVTL